jgi:hypothetical protein
MRAYKNVVTLILCLACVAFVAQGAVNNDHRSVASGPWDLASTWERYNGSSWIPAENPPTSADANVNVRIGHTVEVQYAASIDQLVIDAGGQITVANGVTFTIDEGTGVDLTVHGTLDIQPSATLQFNGAAGGWQVFGTVRNAGTINGSAWYYVDGKYQHNWTSSIGYIPAAAWYGNSTMEVIGYTTVSGNLSVGAQTFNNITWNCPNQQDAINIPSQFTSAAGTFTVASTGTGKLVVNATTSGGSAFFNCGYTQTGGTVDMASSSGTSLVDFEGNVSLLGGTLTETGTSVSNIIRMTANGNFAVNSAFVISNNISFTVFDTYTATLTQDCNLDDATMRVYGILQCGNYVLRGAGFTLYSGATLGIGHDFGIKATADNGNIRTTSRTFDPGANYVYNHPTSMSYAGDGLPSEVASLTSANTGGSLVLQTSVTVQNALTLTTPLSLGVSGENTLTLASGATISGTGYVAMGGVGKFVRYITGDGTYLLRVGTVADYTPAQITLTGSGYAGAHLDVQVFSSKHPNNTSASNYLNRYWTISAPGVSSPSYSASFTYVSGDVVGSEASMICGRYTGSAWVSGNQVNGPANTMDITGQTAFSDFTGGESDQLPIQLARMNALLNGESVTLAWETVSEQNNYGFYVQRRMSQSESFVDVPSGFVSGHGTSVEMHKYAFTEQLPGGGTWEYRLRQVDLDGTEWFSDPVSVTYTTDVPVTEMPMQYVLSQNYPNPFNPSTTIRYGLPGQSHVRIALVDMLGREVAVLADEEQSAGWNVVKVDGSKLASGSYLCRMHASPVSAAPGRDAGTASEDFVGIVRLLLIK